MSISPGARKLIKAMVVGVLVLIALVVVLLVGFVIVAVRTANRVERAAKPPVPAELRTPRELVNVEPMRKDVFLSDPGLWGVSDMATGQVDATPGVAFGFAGRQGADFTDANGRVLASVRYETGFFPGTSQVSLVRDMGGGTCRFFMRGDMGGPVMLLGHDGRSVWRYGSRLNWFSAVDDADVANIGARGEPEFLLGFGGFGGVRLLDARGHELWHATAGNVWGARFLDVDGRGHLVICHSDASGKLTIRSLTGKVERTLRPVSYVSHFATARWPEADSRQYLLIGSETVGLYREDGTIAKTFRIPLAHEFEPVAATPLRLKPSAPESFAILMRQDRLNRSMLCVFDHEGQLVYLDLFADSGLSLLAVDEKQKPFQSLLVGGQHDVYEYRSAGNPAEVAAPGR